MMGFKAFPTAQATIAGIETAYMIRKGQLFEENRRSDSMKSSVSP
jgi:putative transposase